MNEKIYKRKITDEIVSYFDTDNIIVLHGSRQVGKTHILYYLADLLKKQNKKIIFIDLEDGRFVELLDSGIDKFINFLEGEGIDKSRKTYVFIDEIQYLANPSPFLKLVSDHHKYLQLILSGSSSFNIKKKFTDTLVGRTVDFEIYPLDFSEFLDFKGIQIDLQTKSAIHASRLKELFREYILYGGYPKIVLEDEIARKEKYLGQIVNTYLKRDIHDLAQIKQVQKFNRMLKLLAESSGNLLNIAEISQTCGLARETVENYLFILENTYIIKLLPVFSYKAKVEVVKTPKIFFYDTGLLQTVWLRNLTGNILGNMFETSVFSQLIKKYQVDKIYFWRTKRGQEIDFVVLNKQEILPIEAKLNFRHVNRSALITFCRKYKVKQGAVVGLEGEKKTAQDLWPWEINNLM